MKIKVIGKPPLKSVIDNADKAIKAIKKEITAYQRKKTATVKGMFKLESRLEKAIVKREKLNTFTVKIKTDNSVTTSLVNRSEYARLKQSERDLAKAEKLYAALKKSERKKILSKAEKTRNAKNRKLAQSLYQYGMKNKHTSSNNFRKEVYFYNARTPYKMVKTGGVILLHGQLYRTDLERGMRLIVTGRGISHLAQKSGTDDDADEMSTVSFYINNEALEDIFPDIDSFDNIDSIYYEYDEKVLL